MLKTIKKSDLVKEGGMVGERVVLDADVLDTFGILPGVKPLPVGKGLQSLKK